MSTKYNETLADLPIKEIYCTASNCVHYCVKHLAGNVSVNNHMEADIFG